MATAGQVRKIEQACQRAIDEWESGRMCSPDERDYVIDAQRVLNRNLDADDLDRIADALWERTSAGQLLGPEDRPFADIAVWLASRIESTPLNDDEKAVQA